MSSILHYEPFYELLDDSFGNPFHGRSQHVLRRSEGGEGAVRPVKPRYGSALSICLSFCP